MNSIFDVPWICEFRAWLSGEINDTQIGALDRLFNNVYLLEGNADSAAVGDAVELLHRQADAYKAAYIEEHVPALKAIRDATDAEESLCKAVNAWAALSKLDKAMDQLQQDNGNSQFSAANRGAALDAAGEAINSVGDLMSESAVLAGFGEFLVEFVKTAWIPLITALNIHFKRLEWLNQYEQDVGMGPQPL